MLNTTFYEESKKSGAIIPMVLFTEPTPARMKSRIPGMNLYNVFKYGDNNWVSLEMLPDKKTFVGTTDSPKKLLIDVNTLKNKGFLEY